MIKNIIGIILMILGVVLGIYLGFWVMFVGGILGIAKGIDTHTITATLIAINSIKVLFSGFVGFIIGYGLISLGLIVLDD